MIIDKELLNVLYKGLAYVIECLQIRILMIFHGHSYKTIIACGLAVFDLLSFDYTDHAAFDYAARKRRLIHEQENIDGIAVVTSVEGTNPKSYGNVIPSGKTLLRVNEASAGSNLYLLRLCLGVSMTARTTDLSRLSNGPQDNRGGQ
jgi:hypothetical protein